MVKPLVEINIVADSKGEKCDASCGVDWASPESFALATQRIKERFGDGVKLSCLDLAKPATDPDALKWEQRIKKENLPLPVLVINGVPRISGQFDFRLLLDAIDAEIELKS